MPRFLPIICTLPLLSSAPAADGPPPPSQGDDGKPALTRGPYPQLATDSSVRLVWRTRMETKPQVFFGKSAKELTGIVAGNVITERRTEQDGSSSPGSPPLHSAPLRTIQYEALLTGLEPDTVYHYAVQDGARRLSPDDGTCHFRTLPVKGTDRPYRFWVVGDSGTGAASQKWVHKAFKEWRARPERSVDFYVHVGDMAYNKGLDSEFQFGFFEMYDDTLRGMVCWPAMGNHEGGTASSVKGTGPYYDAYMVPTKGEAGGLASGTEAYYSWDYGRTHFIALNTHDLPRGADEPMARWLKADLEQAKADWIIAYWHHPPYTKGSHDSDKEKDLIQVREWIMPIIEAGGVDLVLTGHSHIYERSMLLSGAFSTPTVAANGVLDDRDGDPAGEGPYRKRPGLLPNEGTLQIVTGNGGQALARKDTPSPIMRRSIVEWGSVIVEVKGNALTGIMLNLEGEERDRFQIVKDAVEAPQKIAAPRPPDPPIGPARLKVYVPEKR